MIATCGNLTQPFHIFDIYNIEIKTMKNTFILIIRAIGLLLVLFQISCNNSEDDNLDCNHIACTEEYVIIVLTIKDQNQNPVALDYFEVINAEDGSDLTVPLSPSALSYAQEFGQYPLIADGGIDKNQELQLQFKGFINSQEVINGNYVVGADCCHISLISGDVQLVL